MDRPARRPPRPKPDHTLEVRRILDGCRPLAGSPAEAYLRSRGPVGPGLAGPALPSRPDRLRRRARLAGHGRRPAHVRRRRRSAASTGPSCSRMDRARRRRARRCWGRWRTARCGCLRSATTGISASRKASRPRSSVRAIFGIPVWAALSADGVARWQWPAEIIPTRAEPDLRRGFPSQPRRDSPWKT